MSLTVETGAGVQGAESYAATATIDAFWAARTHNALYTTWSAVSNTTAKKEGAAREASAYIDSVWGPYFKGVRRGYVQGLLFPRTGALDGAGYPLPDLPPELVAAVCELAARAVTSPLAADIDMGARVKSQTKKVGPLEKSTEYFDGGAAPQTAYGVVDNILAPLLNGSQPRAPNAHWSWA